MRRMIMFSCFFMCSFPFSVYTNWIHLKNLFDYPGCFNTRRIVFQQTARPFSPAAVPCRSGWFPHELCFKKNSFLNSDDDVASISHPEKTVSLLLSKMLPVFTSLQELFVQHLTSCACLFECNSSPAKLGVNHPDSKLASHHKGHLVLNHPTPLLIHPRWLLQMHFQWLEVAVRYEEILELLHCLHLGSCEINHTPPRRLTNMAPETMMVWFRWCYFSRGEKSLRFHVNLPREVNEKKKRAEKNVHPKSTRAVNLMSLTCLERNWNDFFSRQKKEHVFFEKRTWIFTDLKHWTS